MSEQGCDLEDRCYEPPPLRLQTVQVKPLPVAACGTAETACCAGGVPVFDGVDPRYKRILWTVIGINGLMFLAEMVAGHLAGSQALKADALDFLADNGHLRTELVGHRRQHKSALNCGAVQGSFP